MCVCVENNENCHLHKLVKNSPQKLLDLRKKFTIKFYPLARACCGAGEGNLFYKCKKWKNAGKNEKYRH